MISFVSFQYFSCILEKGISWIQATTSLISFDIRKKSRNQSILSSQHLIYYQRKEALHVDIKELLQQQWSRNELSYSFNVSKFQLNMCCMSVIQASARPKNVLLTTPYTSTLTSSARSLKLIKVQVKSASWHTIMQLNIHIMSHQTLEYPQMHRVALLQPLLNKIFLVQQSEMEQLRPACVLCRSESGLYRPYRTKLSHPMHVISVPHKFLICWVDQNDMTCLGCKNSEYMAECCSLLHGFVLNTAYVELLDLCYFETFTMMYSITLV